MPSILVMSMRYSVSIQNSSQVFEETGVTHRSWKVDIVFFIQQNTFKPR